MQNLLMVLLTGYSFAVVVHAKDLSQPLLSSDVVFSEQNGLVAVEAEHFIRQEKTEQRAFLLTTGERTPATRSDGDETHIAGAARGAYLECLPDTRRNHDEKLITGENFSNQPGQQAVLTYSVHFENAGRYYVWVRAFSSGSEDNSLHVGLNGTWPESGQRLQWCDGKQSWRWESQQRTEENHCGEPGKIFLDILTPGIHEIQFSMREDGFEFDRWLMTNNPKFERPTGIGPKPLVYQGNLPEPFLFVAAVERQAPHLAQQNSASQLPALELPRQPDGSGTVEISGELKQWHKVTLTVDGPFAHELDNAPNPFLDYQLNVRFTHESGTPDYLVPGYFAADGNAAETSADHGTKWRAHLTPDKTGNWNYQVEFHQGKHLLQNGIDGANTAIGHGQAGTFHITTADKTAPDLRAHGRLQYVGERYLKFAGSGDYFLKAGADAPETLLGYADFDGTRANNPAKCSLKTYQAHLVDWSAGDPVWKNGKGKGLIGGINYLAGKGCNVFSFLTYNAGGDGDNVWPFVERDEKLHYDCSKLDQWGIVFDHGTSRGMYLHFKMQEQEMDDNRRGHHATSGRPVTVSLDDGKLGLERKLYCRELIARFGHALALNWNLGEENTQSPEEQREMAEYIRQVDPYDHPVVIHTFPDWQDKVYPQLLGTQSVLSGASLQNGWNQVHERTKKWVTESTAAGRPWVCCNDEQGPAGLGVPTDPGYAGQDGVARDPQKPDEQGYTLHDIRQQTLWGNLMAGGGGVEYYFGYQLPENDLHAEDFRSRDQSWDYCRIALEFFRDQQIAIQKTVPSDDLITVPKNSGPAYCLAEPGEMYLVYVGKNQAVTLDLSAVSGVFDLGWFDPRHGGELQKPSHITAGKKVPLTSPFSGNDDWLLVLRKQ